jgi:protein tyrosine/serine phosphatase
MVNSSLFRSLCKTFLAAAVLIVSACSAHAQAVPDASVRPGAAGASFGAAAEKIKLAGVPNFGKVSDMLFRGAQPSLQGLTELKKLGVTTIVDLRGNRGPVARERGAVESLGMRFVDLPVNGGSPPTNSQVAEFLRLLQDDPNERVFVHCYFGADRSGVMVAAYRIAQQNWTADQAMAEMHSFGFHYYLYPAMKSYVRKFPTIFGADPVFASLRNSPAQP